MGFYGKVNRTDSNFVIDATYSNRAEMEDALLQGDGIFIGRYVLIDYNKGTAIEDNYVRLYRKDNWSYFFSQDFNSATRTIYSEKPYFITDENGQTIINPEYKEDIKENPYLIFQNQPIYTISESGGYVFYQCISRWSTTSYPLFELMNEAPADTDNYYYNFAQDRARYGSTIGRGWDSTVWQKIYADETEQYAMIAELNSVVPTFNITTDAPTLSPIAPHFDADSTNVYYRLHLQPSWGLRVAKAKSKDESDTYFSHTGSRWNPETNKNDWISEGYDGAIFYNKEGFNPLIRHELSTLEDEIKLLPTGKSGNKYNVSHDGGIITKQEKEDIQELTIHLPSIGNSISKMWDMIYGEGETEGDESGGFKRNDNIDWDNIGGLRLVSTKSDGNGFEYNTKDINTLAGCINSVHDLIGMIITNDKDKKLDIKDALVNRIYYRDGKYYIKDLRYRYKPIPDNAIEIPNMIQFSENSYYKNNDNYYKEQEGYQDGNKYFELVSGEEIIEKPLAEEDWESGKYWYKDTDNNYILDNNTQPDENKEYYKINNENFKSVTTVDHKKLYFFPNDYSDEVFNKLFPTSERIEEDNIIKGDGLFYWGTDTETGYENYLPFEKTIPTNSILFYIKGYTIETSTTVDKGIIKTYDFQNAVKIKISTIPFQANKFYYLDQNKYQILNNLANITIADIDEESDSYKEYYAISNDENNTESITFVPIGNDFYQPNLYYYKDNKDYILAKEKDKLAKKVYYTIDASQAEVDTNVTFYEPNKYYYYDGFNYVIDTNETITKDRTYYKDIYNTYIIATGEKCNPNVNYADLGIDIGYREEYYDWKELNGFSRTLNTINGLILKINNVMKFDDALTRDNKTVQGCINQMNDIINKIDKLKPNHFIAVNEVGKMTSMVPDTDNWIDIKINENNDNKVVITHKFEAVEDKTSTNNMNASDTNEGSDTIVLYTPQVDEKGHIVGKSINTVTLPFSYKTFQDSEETPGKTAAANTQDVLVLKGDNWIKPTITQGEINYSHIGPVKTNEAPKTNLTPAFGDTFEIEDWQFDDKGHKSNKTTHTVKIPQGSLVDNDKNGSDVIVQLGFTPSTGKITTTRNDIATLTLGSYEKGSSKDEILATDTLGTALSKLQTQINEEESTRSFATDNLDKKINDEIKDRQDVISKEVTDRNAAIKVETDARIAAIEAEATARQNAINALDATITTETSELITSITQTDGLISAGKKKVGDLTLGGWTLGQSATNDESIADTDTVNSAFAKAQRQINANKLALNILNGEDTTSGSVAYQITEAINTALVVDKKDKYALATDLTDLSTELSNATERVKNLEDTVPADKIAQWDAAEANVQSDWAETNESADSYIKNKPTLNFVPMETYNALLQKIAALEARIEVLENSSKNSGDSGENVE